MRGVAMINSGRGVMRSAWRKWYIWQRLIEIDGWIAARHGAWQEIWNTETYRTLSGHCETEGDGTAKRPG
jgi:hypothetical protein